MRKKARKKVLRVRKVRETARAILKDENVERAFWRLNEPISFAQQKGLYAEKMTFQSLERLCQMKMLFYQVGLITKITPTEHFSPEDKKKIDIKVRFQRGRVLIDVKSRWNQQLEEELWKNNRCLVAMPFGVTDEEAIKIVLEAVNRFLREKEKEKRNRA